MGSQKCLVVGGCGHFGAIIANKLKIAGNTVHIFDCCMYDNEDVKNEISYDILIKESTHADFNILTFDYDLVIWCSDIDVDSYYDTDYYKRDLECFENTIKEAKRFYYIGNFIGDTNTNRIVYQKFLEERRKIIIDNKGFYFNCGILYGPSPRMRWDTLVNLILYQALSQKQIILQNDWATRFPICNVADAADFIVNIEQPHYDTPICSRNFSIIEISHIIANIVKDVEVITTGVDVNAYDLSMEEVIKESFNLPDTIEYMIKSLEAGHLPDYQKDKYNNELMIHNMLVGREAYERLIGD